MLLACDERTAKHEAAALARRATAAMTAAVDEGASVRDLESAVRGPAHRAPSQRRRAPRRPRGDRRRLIEAINNNARRIDYERWRSRGYQIGSGAMESLHRTASQMRLEVAGIRCLPETSQAVFNLRMRRLCERWDEFWSDPSLTSRLVDAFESLHVHDSDGRQEAA
jgi:hypothetical protein